MLLHNLLLLLLLVWTFPSRTASFSPSPTDDHSSFSLTEYQKARALETFQSLDASRFHFQILFVDDDNAKGRIAEGVFARIVEYNDAMCVLFPESCTIPGGTVMNGEPHEGALAICESLQLCPSRSEARGTSLNLSYHLDQYDLIITMDDDIRSRILRSILGEKEQQEYAAKCRLLSDFLPGDLLLENSSSSSLADSNSSNNANANTILLNMLDEELQDRVKILSSLLSQDDEDDTTHNWNDIFLHHFDNNDKSLFQTSVPATREEFQANHPRIILTPSGSARWNTNQDSWPLTEAVMIVASAGIARFCLDTIESFSNQAFQTLLETNYPFGAAATVDVASLKWEEVDNQLRRCSYSICGYFSPRERKERWEAYCAKCKNRK